MEELPLDTSSIPYQTFKHLTLDTDDVSSISHQTFKHLALDNLLEILDELEIQDILSLFNTSKGLPKNDPLVLKYLSDRFGLPYVSSYKNLVYLIHMDWKDLFIHGLDIVDYRVLDHLYYIYDLGYLVPYAASINRFDIIGNYPIPSDAVIPTSAIINCINNKEWRILEKLLTEGDVKYDYDAALALIKSSDTQIFDIYLYKIRDHDIRDKLLYMAVEDGSFLIVRLLYREIYDSVNGMLPDKLNPSFYSYVPIDLYKVAIENNHTDIVLYLLREERQMDPSIVNKVVKLAIEIGNTDIVNAIKERYK